MSLFFITGNEHKMNEVKSMLPGVQQLDVDVPEIQSLDSKEVIVAKLQAAKVLRPNDAFMVEDTSLVFECLGQLPGPLIKWFVSSLGREKLAQLALQGDSQRAVAKTMVGYAAKDQEPLFFEGVVEGTIVAPKGDSGFGWDPIFVPDGYEETFAQLGQEVKNKLSMRRKAVEQLKNHLSQVQ